LPLLAPLRLNKGTVELEIRAPGFASDRRALTIEGGNPQAVRATLRELSATTRPVEKVTPSLPLIAVPTPPPVATATTTAASNGSTTRTLAWAGVAAATLTLGFGVLETMAWLGKQDEFDNHVGSLPTTPSIMGKNCGSGEQNYGGVGCKQLHDELAMSRGLAIGGYAAAAALTVVSVFLFSMSAPAQAPGAMAFSCAPDMARGLMFCRASFLRG
jgi:hypothetical protein